VILGQESGENGFTAQKDLLDIIYLIRLHIFYRSTWACLHSKK